MAKSIISKTKRVCQVEGCMAKHKGHGYCNRHLKQMQQYGHIRRTMYDPNTFELKNGICLIGLFEKYGEQIATAIIDASDYSLVKGEKWGLCPGSYGSYVACGNKKKNIKLSRLIMDAKSGEEVDHKNHNLLDNRRSNLRVCIKAQNQQNALLRIDNTSGVKGVSWDKRSKRWYVSIQKNKIGHHIGYFKNLADAEIAVKKARLELHEEFACNG